MSNSDHPLFDNITFGQQESPSEKFNHVPMKERPDQNYSLRSDTQLSKTTFCSKPELSNVNEIDLINQHLLKQSNEYGPRKSKPKAHGMSLEQISKSEVLLPTPDKIALRRQKISLVVPPTPNQTMSSLKYTVKNREDTPVPLSISYNSNDISSLKFSKIASRESENKIRVSSIHNIVYDHDNNEDSPHKFQTPSDQNYFMKSNFMKKGTSGQSVKQLNLEENNFCIETVESEIRSSSFFRGLGLANPLSCYDTESFDYLNAIYEFKCLGRSKRLNQEKKLFIYLKSPNQRTVGRKSRHKMKPFCMESAKMVANQKDFLSKTEPFIVRGPIGVHNLCNNSLKPQIVKKIKQTERSLPGRKLNSFRFSTVNYLQNSKKKLKLGLNPPNCAPSPKDENVCFPKKLSQNHKLKIIEQIKLPLLLKCNEPEVRRLKARPFVNLKKSLRAIEEKLKIKTIEGHLKLQKKSQNTISKFQQSQTSSEYYEEMEYEHVARSIDFNNDNIKFESVSPLQVVRINKSTPNFAQFVRQNGKIKINKEKPRIIRFHARSNSPNNDKKVFQSQKFLNQRRELFKNITSRQKIRNQTLVSSSLQQQRLKDISNSFKEAISILDQSHKNMPTERSLEKNEMDKEDTKYSKTDRQFYSRQKESPQMTQNLKNRIQKFKLFGSQEFVEPYLERGNSLKRHQDHSRKSHKNHFKKTILEASPEKKITCQPKSKPRMAYSLKNGVFNRLSSQEFTIPEQNRTLRIKKKAAQLSKNLQTNSRINKFKEALRNSKSTLSTTRNKDKESKILTHSNKENISYLINKRASRVPQNTSQLSEEDISRVLSRSRIAKEMNYHMKNTHKFYQNLMQKNHSFQRKSLSNDSGSLDGSSFFKFSKNKPTKQKKKQRKAAKHANPYELNPKRPKKSNCVGKKQNAQLRKSSDMGLKKKLSQLKEMMKFM